MAVDDDEADGRANAAGRILCLTGPESSGKTALAEGLAQHFGGSLVPEVARTYLADRQHYDAADLMEIARLQMAAEAAAFAETEKLVVCDTDLLVIRVWWQERFGELPTELLEMLARQPATAYLLATPDLPWEADPLRENPADRDRLYSIYESILLESRIPYRTVAGLGEARLANAVAAARALLPTLLS